MVAQVFNAPTGRKLHTKLRIANVLLTFEEVWTPTTPAAVPDIIAHKPLHAPQMTQAGIVLFLQKSYLGGWTTFNIITFTVSCCGLFLGNHLRWN